MSWFLDLKNLAMAVFNCNMPFTKRQPYCWIPLRLLMMGKLPIRVRLVVNQVSVRSSNNQLHAIYVRTG